ncbi:hypothetical protein HUT18_24065 [Streptomyces sp. NA04227]|uniref:hypothetical protein n=1 Tax=Streptomyces sp. NA04227 TaxID=2742136 RepID=UPI0015923904|nr:hypothetical protein [Streptomyces sp. NA04227]QKW09000.1 hypothetical protein HUT18_24065 [Streptomyces sp. NA04227]
MTVDPSDPETFDEADTLAAPGTAQRHGSPGSYEETDVEAPEADAAEQHTELSPRRDEPLDRGGRDDADEGDRAEQARVVELDEDDYR